MFMIRNLRTGEVAALAAGKDAVYPQWVHEQCSTRSEAELQALIESLDPAALLRVGRPDERGIFVNVPRGAMAWKRADPFQSARWLFDESAVQEAAELDPDIVVRMVAEQDADSRL